MSKSTEYKEACGVTGQYGHMAVTEDGVVLYHSMDATDDGRSEDDPSRRVVSVIATDKEGLIEMMAFFMHVLQDHMDVDTGEDFTQEEVQQLDPRLAAMLNLKHLH